MIAVTAPVVPVRNPTTATASAITNANKSCKAMQRPELVQAGVVGPADERRSQTPIGKEVPDCDHSGSERHHAERGRRELVYEHERADESDHLSARRADRQQHGANCTAIAYGRRTLRAGLQFHGASAKASIWHGRPERRGPDVLGVDRPTGGQGGSSKRIVRREHRRYRLSAGPHAEPAKD